MAPAPRARIVHIHPQAPPKPALGTPCNGCGLCCLSEPCPVGIVLSRRRHGPCVALRWDDAESRYRCGLLSPGGAPSTVRASRWERLRPAGWLNWLWRRWIAAGQGCDAALSASPAPGATPEASESSQAPPDTGRTP